MTQHISDYIKEINALYQTGLTTEHSFRPALQKLLQECTSLQVINEQKHIDCGAPDLTLLHKHIPIAYIEAKDLEDGDLDGRKKNREQFDRYKASLDTIIFTDYLDFHLYQNGQWQQSVRLAEIQGNKIRLTNSSSPDAFIALMQHLQSAKPQRITSATRLAQLMAAKARLLRDIIEQALLQDGDQPTELRGYMMAFQQVLIHDITPKSFADIYAQTIAYGMFAARMHDTSAEDFTRAEAANLIPKSNPFLRKVFQQIAGYDLDERIAWIVDDLVAAFAATDMEKILDGFGKNTEQTDPILHFYEDFLFQYDPAAKKQCGVYYTPQPVVNFIVRAVNDILKQEFGLPLGLADTSKVEIEREIPQDLKHRKEKVQVHRVQVLDPATGTGTFLAETVRQIKRNLCEQMGAWSSYVPEHLLPRLHGFELMMAPYTIAHLKLDIEIGTTAQQRLKVFLTNSLEEHNQDAGTLFGNYLAQEANEASAIKRDAPVMIVMGNPPYSGESQNKSEWIMMLMEDYKKEPGGKQKLQERNPKWINDDYCKFIRLGQHYVDRNKEGVLAYICNNGFLDNPTFRGMRWHLLNSFDKIYIINLHGNSKKKETTPDGNKDENVFDIMVGTSINIFVKTGKKKKGELAEVFYSDQYGLRKDKYNFLNEHDLTNIEFTQVEYKSPFYFFIPMNTTGEDEYNKGFKLDELLCTLSPGVVTANDGLFINANKDILVQKIFAEYGHINQKSVQKYAYRPLDFQYVYYDTSKIARAREKVMRNMKNENFALIFKKGFPNSIPPIFVSDTISDFRFWSCSGMQGGDYAAPLYLYPEEGSLDTERRPNLDTAIWQKINTLVGHDTTPEDIFDYIYGILHSPAYRTKYKEFLKVDFPRIPYPANEQEFNHYRHYGHLLRELHLMHNVPESPATFPNDGSMQVDSIRWEWNIDDGYSGNVYINDQQCFEGVPTVAWEMYIGGYQPAQKWLKDRKGRTLSFDNIEHYRRIIAVLLATHNIMQDIDLPLTNN